MQLRVVWVAYNRNPHHQPWFKIEDVSAEYSKVSWGWERECRCIQECRSTLLNVLARRKVRLLQSACASMCRHIYDWNIVDYVVIQQKHTITYTHIISNEIRCCCEILCPWRQQSSKKVCTVGDGDLMFRMHTQPMKLFQIESMSGTDPDILLGGGVHYLPRKFDTQKQKRKQQQQQQQQNPDRSRGGGCFSTLYTWSMASEFLWGREGKGGDMIFVLLLAPTYTNTYLIV